MNPLGSLPATSSPQFSISAIDWEKICRAALVQVISLFVTLGVPRLLSFTYIYHGVNYTPEVLLVVNGAAEAARRFLTGAPRV
jgi:hypothetical protein